MDAERRKARREANHQPVWLVVESYGRKTMWDAFLLDSSPHGVRIQLGIPLITRQIVDYIPTASLAPPVRCEVKWVGRQISGFYQEAGLEFLARN